MFSQARGVVFDAQPAAAALAAAQNAIGSASELTDGDVKPRVYSSAQWQNEMAKVDIEKPAEVIDTEQEPDPRAVFGGQLAYDTATFDPLGRSRYGTFFVNYTSDLYLFAIAADYQFQAVKHWLVKHGIGTGLFDDRWSRELGALADEQGVQSLFEGNDA